MHLLQNAYNALQKERNDAYNSPSPLYFGIARATEGYVNKTKEHYRGYCFSHAEGFIEKERSR